MAYTRKGKVYTDDGQPTTPVEGSHVLVKLTVDQHRSLVEGIENRLHSLDNLLNNPVWVQNQKDYQSDKKLVERFTNNRAFQQRLLKDLKAGRVNVT